MLLSSYNRVLRYCSPVLGDNLTDDNKSRRDLMTWLPSVSALIEDYLNRKIYVEARTEYFDVGYNTYEFFPKAYPVTSVTSVYSDSTGIWDGSESEVDDDSFHISAESNSVVLTYRQRWEKKRGLRIIYTGGLASHAANSVYNVVYTGSMTVAKYVYGVTSGAIGIINAVNTSTLTIEVLYGKFSVLETVQEWETESSRGASTATAVLSSASSLSLCESYPAIVSACEAQIRFMWTNKDRFEVGNVQKDGTQSRRTMYNDDAQIQPEVAMMLRKYKRISV